MVEYFTHQIYSKIHSFSYASKVEAIFAFFSALSFFYLLANAMVLLEVIGILNQY